MTLIARLTLLINEIGTDIKNMSSNSTIGTDKAIDLEGVTTEPNTPANNFLKLYAKKISGFMAVKIKGASGLDFPLQTAFWQSNIIMWNPTNATAGLWLGTVGAGAGTYTTLLPTDINIYTSIKRGRWANVVTTLNQVLGQRNLELLFFRGSTVIGAGGFKFFARGGMDIWTNGARFFTGMHSATTVVSANPSLLNNTVGFCVDNADNGLIYFLTRDTVATKVSTGFYMATNVGYDFYIFSAPNGTSYTWRIVNLNTGAEANGIATTNLPTVNTKLTAGFLASNALLTPVNSVQIGLNRLYIEKDY